MENLKADLADSVVHEEKINLRHYWHVVLERRWLVIAAFFSVFALCLIYLFKATPIFQAAARMQIDRESENVLNLKDVFSVDGREQDYLQTQYKNLQSRSLVESVVNKLKLRDEADWWTSRCNTPTLARPRRSRTRWWTRSSNRTWTKR